MKCLNCGKRFLPLDALDADRSRILSLEAEHP
jgi:hypothetical protein